MSKKTKCRTYCAVHQCRSQKTNENLSFFRLPFDEDRHKIWCELIGRPELAQPANKNQHHVVCSLHFEKSDINNRPRLKPDVLPSRLLPDRPGTSTSTNSRNHESLTQINKSHVDVESKSVQATTSSKSEATQTTLELSSDTPSKRKLSGEIEELKNENKKLKLELEKIKKELQGKQSEHLERFNFKTEDEVTKRFLKLIEWQKELKNKSKRDGYNRQFALNLRFSSPQTYRTLKKILTLPSETTLERLKLCIPPKFGIRTLDFLSAKMKSLPKDAKYCTLCVDEMVVKRHLYYDTRKDEVVGLHNINGKVIKEVASNACVVMLRGIMVNWKEPIAYSFLSSPNHYKRIESWLDEIISKLFSIGIEITAVVSDQGSNFDKYAKKKGVTPEKPYFLLNEKQIFYIFDVPHLMKCIRDNLLTNNFTYDDKTISWKYIDLLYTEQKDKDLKLIPKITEKHVKPNNFQKMHVKYASQIFSMSVCTALRTLIQDQCLPEEAMSTAEFVEEINNLFDILNSSSVQATNKYKREFSLEKYQLETLENALAMCRKIKANPIDGSNNTNKIKTFTNLQITIQSIIMLTENFKTKGFNYIYTRRLNQDCLEKVFGAIRQKGGNCRDPTPIMFMRRISKLFLGNMLENSRVTNCEEDICELLQKDVTFENSKFTDSFPSTLNSRVALDGETDYRFDLPSENALTYTAGYLLFKCSKRHMCPEFDAKLKQMTNLADHRMFTHFKAFNKTSGFYGELKMPSDEFYNYIKSLESVFISTFGEFLTKRPGSSIYERMKLIYFNQPCDCFPSDYLIKLFVRLRIFTTIRFNNRKFRQRREQMNNYIKVRHL